MKLLSFNLLDWFTRPRTNFYPKLPFDFICTACDHAFKRKIRRLYVDLNTYDQRHIHQMRPIHSEFIVAERIICPKCQKVDQFKLGPGMYRYLTETPLISNNGLPYPNRPIQCIRFALRDGRAMHPLAALKWLQDRVEGYTDGNEMRLEYANLLRMLGYHQEAEAQYHLALTRNPQEPEALFNLAVFHGKRREKDAAVSYLHQLTDPAQHTDHPEQPIFAQAAQDIMDGAIQMDSIELTAPVLFDFTQL